MHHSFSIPNRNKRNRSENRFARKQKGDFFAFQKSEAELTQMKKAKRNKKSTAKLCKNLFRRKTKDVKQNDAETLFGNERKNMMQKNDFLFFSSGKNCDLRFKTKSVNRNDAKNPI